MLTPRNRSVVKTTVKKDRVILKISGDFDYYMNSSFHRAYKSQPAEYLFVIDLHHATFIDSSAIGMLLILLDYVGNNKEKLQIVGSNQTIKRALDMARLGEIMTIVS